MQMVCKVMLIYTTIVKKHTIIQVLPVVNCRRHGNHFGRLYVSPRVEGHITVYRDGQGPPHHRCIEL